MTELRPVPNEDQAPEEKPGRIPPHNLEAEESLLGAMMLSRDAIEVALGLVRGDDFYKPAHRTIFESIVDLYEHGQPVDPVTLATSLELRQRLNLVGGRAALLAIQGATPASANATHYARIIVTDGAKRRLIHAGYAIADLGYDREVDPVAGTVKAAELVANAEVPLGGEPSEDIATFLSRRTEHEWLWPGVLETHERLLIVAPEKYGKSTMIRQMAVCLSQGMDPFRPERSIPPVLVHVVDLENPEPLVRRKIGALYDACNTLERPAEPLTLRIDCKPEGLDIANHRADELWLAEKVAANRAEWARMGAGDWPMVLCIGPIYKMLENELDPAEVRKLQAALDRLRKRFRCALIMETHAPHESFQAKAPERSLRPAGPRVWIRWPEFCRAVEPWTGVAATTDRNIADFYDVQGARDERDWPRRLRRGGTFPWVEDPGY